MTFERSHGKARPTLVRASDLQPSESAGDWSDGRARDGRFAAGNRASVGHGWKATIRKLLGPKVDSVEARAIRRDAWRVFTSTIQAMPSDAAPVRAMVSLYAGHVALAAFYRAQATGAGLDTEKGLALLVVADRQSQRSERVLVTAHDLARVHAEHEARKPRSGPSIWDRLNAPDPEPPTEDEPDEEPAKEPSK